MSDLNESILTGILTGLAADALWEGGKWAIIKYKQQRANGPRPVLISAMGGGSSDGAATLTVGKYIDFRWKVKAPKPSLASRLEDLTLWYLHVS